MTDDSLYSRQSSLTLKKYTNCIVVGVGGIGNWVALDLALSGCVENLYLIDPDTIEESNLNRTLFDYSDIGCYKVDSVLRQIALRRPQQNIYVLKTYMTNDLAIKFIDKIMNGDNSYYHDDCCIIDCRDDIYDDCYQLNCKLYKVGYDGAEMTIDGNPRLTQVFGQRGGSYTVTPSYVGSAQLAAILVVNDMLYPKFFRMKDKAKLPLTSNIVNTKSELFPYINKRACFEHDELGRLNDCININSCEILQKFVENSTEYVIPNDNFDNLPNNKSEE